MSAENSTFSESWYRVSSQRISLRPDIVIRRQNFRGERWFVIEDRFSNQFFRIRPESYEFLARLDPSRTVEEVWRECLQLFPDTAPGQETVIQLLSQLYFSNLLKYESAADTAQTAKQGNHVAVSEHHVHAVSTVRSGSLPCEGDARRWLAHFLDGPFDLGCSGDLRSENRC